MIVARLEHGRQGKQAHQGHHGTDDSGSRRKQRTGDQRRHSHGAGNCTKRQLQAVKQAVEDVRSLDDVTHEQEQWNGHQHIIVHDAEGVLRQEIKDTTVEKVLARLIVSVVPEADAHGHQRESDRETEQYDEDE